MIDCFVNPYNFISLGGKCSRPEADSAAKTYTGVMQCTLKTLTPLFIPRNALSEDGEPRKDDIEFFSYDHKSTSPKPVIPGSSIRGMVRSVYEALTNSCLSTVDDEDVLYKRTTEPKRPGLLFNSGTEEEPVYTLFAAQRVLLNTRGGTFGIIVPLNKYHTGEKVYIKTVDKKGRKAVAAIKKANSDGHIEGYVLIGEEFQNKHYDSVFVRGAKIAADADQLKDDYNRLKQVWRLYQTKKNGGVNEGDGAYDGYLSANPLPVFYCKNPSGGHYLSPACITKEVFSHSMKGILEAQGGYQSCDKQNCYCEACRLFGMVDGDDQGALASRVMFRDALPKVLPTDEEGWYDRPRSIILGGPKVTATEFYMEDAGGAYFTYDYRVDSYRHTPAPRLSIKPKLRGRKFYWHSQAQRDAQKDNKNVKMTKTIRPVSAGKVFKFSVAFDRVTADELAKLKFALTLAFDNKSDDYAHKLGHGKPIGFGSVKITVGKPSAYEVNADFELVPVDLPDLTWKPESTLPIREMQRMLNWTERPANVRYPGAGEGGKIYEWFVKNKTTEEGRDGKQNFTKPNSTFVLPYPLSGSLALPGTIYQGKGNRAEVARERAEGFMGVQKAPTPVPPVNRPPANRSQGEKKQCVCSTPGCGEIAWVSPSYEGNYPKCQKCQEKSKNKKKW